jgi:hypothetical protein
MKLYIKAINTQYNKLKMTSTPNITKKIHIQPNNLKTTLTHKFHNSKTTSAHITFHTETKPLCLE